MICFAELFNLEFNLEFKGQGNITGFQLEEEFELELCRTLLSDVATGAKIGACMC